MENESESAAAVAEETNKPEVMFNKRKAHFLFAVQVKKTVCAEPKIPSEMEVAPSYRHY